jgi:proliferating cell nuclear antigen
MKIIVKDKKKELFIHIFHLLKNNSDNIHVIFNSYSLHIQGMDKSHICLFDLTLTKDWFDYFEVESEEHICFNSHTFYSIISNKSDDQNLVIKKEDDDSLNIELINEIKKTEYNKHFKIPLLEYEYDELIIPNVDYHCEMTISSKKISDMLSQLNNFNDIIRIQCFDNFVDFSSKGNLGEMRVNIPIEDLVSYTIVQEESLDLTYNLVYIQKMCISNKLTNYIDLSLTNECPMRINYNLSNNSSLIFFIAPKLGDE